MGAFLAALGAVLLFILRVIGILLLVVLILLVLLLLCGLFNPMISQILETTSTSYAPTSLIACVSSITPILVVVLSILINKDAIPSKQQVFFMLVTVSGVFIMNFGHWIPTDHHNGGRQLLHGAHHPCGQDVSQRRTGRYQFFYPFE